MGINAQAQQALNARSTLVGSWVEIEGVKDAYGTFAYAGSFFSARPAKEQFLSIKPHLAAIPKVIDQTIDTMKGGNLSSGQVVFEVNDVTGDPTSWTNIATPPAYLTVARTASDTLLYVSNTLGYSIGQYLYIGSEVVQITAVNPSGPGTLTVTRGMFRSTAMAYPALFPYGLSLYTMANRRVWFYQVFDSGSRTPGQWSTLSLDTMKVLRFSGVLRACHMKDGEPGIYVLTAESIDREIDRPVFRNIRQFRLSGTSIKDGTDTAGYPTQVAGFPGYTPGYDMLHNFDGTPYTLNEELLMQIDDEIFACRVDSKTPARIRLLARGLYGTVPQSHKEGAIVRELIPMCARATSVSAPWHQRVSKFAAHPLFPGRQATADHPVILALQVLCSTGTGTNFGSWDRNCDRLPADWGLGVSHTRVDFGACEKAAAEDPIIRCAGFISESMNAVDFFRQLLVFGGYYFFVATGDLFTIRRLRPPLPDETYRTINTDSRIRGQWPSWDANWSGAVREVEFKFGHDLLKGGFKRITIFKLNDADIFSKGTARTLSFESKFLYPGGSNIPGDIASRATDLDAWLLTRRDYFMLRYGKPPPMVTVRVDYSYLGVEVGDLVAIQVDWMPNGVGARGMNNIAEVTGKAVDDQSRTVELKLLLTGFDLGFYRYIAPSHIITDFDSPGGYVDIFNVAGSNSSNTNGNDAEVTVSGGQYAWNWGEANQVIMWKADFSLYEVLNVISWDGNNLRVSEPTLFGPNVFDFITPVDIDTYGGYVDDFYAKFFGLFAVDSEIKTVGEPPHRYFPA